MTKNLTREKPNMGRQFEVDLARAFAIFTMVLVHLFERQDWKAVLGHPLSVAIEFAGGPLSAPVFMTAMGIGIAYSKRQDAAAFAARCKQLVAQGYRLNFWRGGLLFLVLYTLTADDSWLIATVEHMLTLDILQFAGIAFLLFALLRRLGARPWQVLALAVLMELAASLLPPVVADSLLPAGLVGYFFYQNPATCFPLFSWFIYPAAGYCFARILQRTADKTRLYTRVLLAGAALCAALSALLLATGYELTEIFMTHDYYAQGMVRAGWILSVCAMVYGLFYFVSLAVGPGRLRSVVQFMSNKVNDIYIYQWVLIMWLHQFVIARLAPTPLVFWGSVLGILVLSVLLAYARQWLTERFPRQNTTD